VSVQAVALKPSFTTSKFEPNNNLGLGPTPIKDVLSMKTGNSMIPNLVETVAVANCPNGTREVGLKISA
jgi:hypothetical protein